MSILSVAVVLAVMIVIAGICLFALTNNIAKYIGVFLSLAAICLCFFIATYKDFQEYNKDLKQAIITSVEDAETKTKNVSILVSNYLGIHEDDFILKPEGYSLYEVVTREVTYLLETSDNGTELKKIIEIKK